MASCSKHENPAYRLFWLCMFTYRESLFTGGINWSNGPWTRGTCWMTELRSPFAHDRLPTFWHLSQMPDKTGLILDQIPHCTELSSRQMPGVCPGGHCFQSSKNEEKWNACVMSANTESYFVVFVLEMLQICRKTFWDPKKWNVLHF